MTGYATRQETDRRVTPTVLDPIRVLDEVRREVQRMQVAAFLIMETRNDYLRAAALTRGAIAQGARGLPVSAVPVPLADGVPDGTHLATKVAVPGSRCADEVRTSSDKES